MGHRHRTRADVRKSVEIRLRRMSARLLRPDDRYSVKDHGPPDTHQDAVTLPEVINTRSRQRVDHGVRQRLRRARESKPVLEWTDRAAGAPTKTDVDLLTGPMLTRGRALTRLAAQ